MNKTENKNGCVAMVVRGIIMALLVMLTAWIVPGIEVGGFWAALWVGIVIGVLNMFVKPLMMFITIPINFITLGLFTLVINAFLIWLTGAMLDSFFVEGFWAAFWFALIYGIARGVIFETSEKKK